MDYKEKYNKLVEAIKVLQETNSSDEGIQNWVNDNVPELRKSEDEKISKLCKELIESAFMNELCNKEERDTCIAWLEKQKSEPNWCHHKVDLSNCSEEYRKAYYDGWYNCNIQHSQYKSESNDVIKCLINGLNFYYGDVEEATWGTEKFSMKVKDIIAWLEKQGNDPKASYTTIVETGDGGINALVTNELLTDMDEPKFHEGDWIISKYMHLVMQILNNDNGSYKTVETDGTERKDSYDFIERNFKLWTIQDANDGDVLDANGAPFIYRKHDKDYVYFYCGVNLADEFIEANGIDIWNNNNKVYPATKQQQDILFQKMHEFGYAWNVDTKELKKIEQNHDWSEEDAFRASALTDVVKSGGSIRPELRNEFVDWLKSLRPQSKQEWSEDDEKTLNEIFSVAARASLRKSTLFGKSYDYIKWQNWLKSLRDRVLPQPKQEWNEEDNKIIEEIINDIECARAINYHAPKEGYEFRENWLKSLRDRVLPQPKQEWSEEDKCMLNNVIDALKPLSQTTHSSYAINSMIDWLNSLRPQNTWRPSDEQIKALQWVLNNIPYNTHKEEISGLLGQIKNL